jgi:hypothetical protein
MCWGELGFWAVFAQLLVVDSTTSTAFIKLETHHHFRHVGAISPISDDEFSTPA